jgi:MFS family permease
MDSAGVNPDLMTSLRALPRVAWFIFAGTFINRCGSLVMPFITLYLTRQQHSVADAGWTLFTFGLGNLGATLVGGHLADRIGRKRTMMLSLFSTSAVVCLLPHATSLAGIQALMFLTGLAGELYRPAVNALIADFIPLEHRLTAYAANRTALNAGWALGPALGGFLAHHSWALLFYADAATTFLFGLIAWKALPDGDHSRELMARWSGIWREVFRNRPFLAFASANLCLAIVFMQMNSTFSLIVFFELPLTAVTRRFRSRNVIAAGYFLCGTGMTFAVGANSIPSFVLVMMIFTLGEMLSLPMAATYLAQIAPEAGRGRFMGVFGLTWALSMLIGPKLGLAVYARQPDLWWWICGGLGALAAILMLAGTPSAGRSRLA